MIKERFLRRGLIVLAFMAMAVLVSPLSSARAVEGAKGLYLDDAAQFRYAEFLMNEGDYRASAREFSRFIATFPESPLLPNAHFKVAESYLSAGRYSKAEREFVRFINNFPDHDKAAEAELLFWTLSEERKRKEADLKGMLAETDTKEVESEAFKAVVVLKNLESALDEPEPPKPVFDELAVPLEAPVFPELSPPSQVRREPAPLERETPVREELVSVPPHAPIVPEHDFFAMQSVIEETPAAMEKEAIVVSSIDEPWKEPEPVLPPVIKEKPAPEPLEGLRAVVEPPIEEPAPPAPPALIEESFSEVEELPVEVEEEAIAISSIDEPWKEAEPVLPPVIKEEPTPEPVEELHVVVETFEESAPPAPIEESFSKVEEVPVEAEEAPTAISSIDEPISTKESLPKEEAVPVEVEEGPLVVSSIDEPWKEAETETPSIIKKEFLPESIEEPVDKPLPVPLVKESFDKPAREASIPIEVRPSEIMPTHEALVPPIPSTIIERARPRPDLLRAAQVMYFDGDTTQDIARELDQLKLGNINAIIVRVFHNQYDTVYRHVEVAKGEDVGAGVYFKTGYAPVIADILGDIATMAHQRDISVFAWMTTRYANYGIEEREDLACKGYDLETDMVMRCKGLDLFNERNVERLEGLFRDIAAYDVDGILFQDDLVLRHTEGYGDVASVSYMAETGRRLDPALMYIKRAPGKGVGYTEEFWRWARWKNKKLLAVADRLKRVSAQENPRLKFAINFMYESVTNPGGSLAWLSQDLEKAKDVGFDYYSIMAYHRQIGEELDLDVAGASELIEGLVHDAVEIIGDPKKVLIKLQTVDWHTGKRLPEDEVVTLLKSVSAASGVSLAVVPYKIGFPFGELGGLRAVATAPASITDDGEEAGVKDR